MMQPSKTTPSLTSLREAGYLSELDLHFAATLSRMVADDDADVRLALALVCRDVREGHVCLDIDQRFSTPLILHDREGNRTHIDWPSPTRLLDALKTSKLVSDGAHPAPLVLDAKNRLYLHRLWAAEQNLAEALFNRSVTSSASMGDESLKEAIARLFGDPDEQALAALVALLRPLLILSGGPGTGKTTTVNRILVLLVEQMRHLSGPESPLPRVALAAPTGKAAKRLSQSIRQAKQARGAFALDCAPDILSAIPDDAFTLHRLLGARLRDKGDFSRRDYPPLPFDIVVVDEASMVDLSLMTELVKALAPDTRLLLLGDKDQLVSVEAGAILGDIFRATRDKGASNDFVSRITRILSGFEVPFSVTENGGGIGDCAVHLTHSYRFDSKSPIGSLSAAVREGDTNACLETLLSASTNDLLWLQPNERGDLPPAALELIRSEMAAYLASQNEGEALAHLNDFRILAAQRKGPLGMNVMNDTARAVLGLQGFEDWYPLRPIMIGANDYTLDLYNGDMGVLWKMDNGEIRAVFEPAAKEDTLRSFSPGMLPAHETAWAMTIHKSQGSEYDCVMITLPPYASPTLSRELIYTAVTRAKRRVILIASEPSLIHAIATPVRRASGLSDALLDK